MAQGRPSNTALKKKQSLALARQLRLEARKVSKPAVISPNPGPNDTENLDAENESSDDEIKCTGWSGGVTHYVSSDEEPICISDDDGEEEVEELSGSELEDATWQHGELLAGTTTAKQATAGTAVEELLAAQPIAEADTPSVLANQRTNQEWKKAESTRSLGYNGQSARTKRHRAKAARDKEMEDAKLRKG